VRHFGSKLRTPITAVSTLEAATRARSSLLRFQYNDWEFEQDGDNRLELAYALTIHKS